MTEARPNTIEAIVVAELPQHLYRLETAEGSLVTASPSEQTMRLGVRIRTGQRVLARRASLDPSRAIVLGIVPSARPNTEQS